MTVEEFNGLKAKHDTAVRAMQAAVNELKADNLTEARKAELEGQFAKAEADERAASETLQRANRLLEAERRAASEFAEREEAEGRMGRKKEGPSNEDKLDIFKRGIQFGVNELDTEERAIFQSMFVAEKRGTNTQIVGTNSLGGYLVPVLLQNEIIASMKDYSGILQACRIRYTAKGGQITFPSRDLTSRAAVKTAESGSIAIQDITYGQKVMDAYKYTDALKIDWELMQDSEFDILSEFREAFSESFGRAMNNTLTLGDGSGDPNGVVVASSLGVTAASATAIALSELIDLMHSVDPAYRRSNSCGYMMHDTVLLAIKKLALAHTGSDGGIWQPSFRDGAPATINGFQYWLNQDMDSSINAASKLVLFGDFSKYNARIVKDMTIQRNDYLHMGTGEVGFYAHARWDGELFDTAAVKHLITAAS